MARVIRVEASGASPRVHHVFGDDARFGPERWFMAHDLFAGIVRDAPRGARFVEIGAFKGRSAAFLAVEMANADKDLHLTTIDPFVHAGTEAICRRNLAPFAEWVTVMTEASPAAAQHFEDGSLWFVFIDGDHRYDAVRADIAAWRPKIAPGGILGGDDFWQREPDVGIPSRGGRPFPVWSAVEDSLGRTYNLFVRRGRGIWWKRL